MQKQGRIVAMNKNEEVLIIDVPGLEIKNACLRKAGRRFIRVSAEGLQIQSARRAVDKTLVLLLRRITGVFYFQPLPERSPARP